MNIYVVRHGETNMGKNKIIVNEKELLNENHILTIDWNALTGDSETSNPSPEVLMKNLKVTTNGKNSVVILMHDTAAKKVTVDILPQVIEYLNCEGYEFKTFYDEINM